MSRVDVTDERYQKALAALNKELRRVHGPDAALFAADGTHPRYILPITLSRMRELRSNLLQLATHPDHPRRSRKPA